MEAYALTDTGRVRTMNQDYIYSSPEKVGSLPNLFLVADGMGGHRAGDYASRFAVENLVIYINRAGDGSPVMQLKKGIETVNGMLYEESLKREELKGMGCTLVAGVVEDNILYVANVGDSRLYLIHGDSIRQVTRDHSYVEEMVAIGQMRRGSEDYNRRKNIITRALGIGREVEPDFFEVDQFHCDCSQLGPVPGQEGQRHEHHGDADSVPGHFPVCHVPVRQGDGGTKEACHIGRFRHVHHVHAVHCHDGGCSGPDRRCLLSH